MAYIKLQAMAAAAVTPSDTVNIPDHDSSGSNRGCALYVGTGGNLAVRTAAGDDVTLVNVADGSFLPIQVVRVFATGTTAADILALW